MAYILLKFTHEMGKQRLYQYAVSYTVPPAYFATVVDNYKHVRNYANIYFFFCVLFIETVLVTGKYTRIHVLVNDADISKDDD